MPPFLSLSIPQAFISTNTNTFIQRRDPGGFRDGMLGLLSASASWGPQTPLPPLGQLPPPNFETRTPAGLTSLSPLRQSPLQPSSPLARPRMPSPGAGYSWLATLAGKAWPPGLLTPLPLLPCRACSAQKGPFNRPVSSSRLITPALSQPFPHLGKSQLGLSSNVTFFTLPLTWLHYPVLLACWLSFQLRSTCTSTQGSKLPRCPGAAPEATPKGPRAPQSLTASP